MAPLFSFLKRLLAEVARLFSQYSKRFLLSMMHTSARSPIASSRTPYRVLVAGGSYAGLSATLNLLDLCHGNPTRFSAARSPEVATSSNERLPVQITIVDERDGYYHLIGAPLVFASQDYALKAWKKFQDIPALQTPEVKCVQGRVIAVDPESKTATVLEAATNNEVEEKYDYFVAATGLSRSWPSAPQSLTREEYLLETRKHIKLLENAREKIVIIGGGAVGVEMAAELKLAQPDKCVTLIHSRPKLLSSEPLPDDYRDNVFSLLQESGVETIMNSRVQEIAPEMRSGFAPSTTLKLEDGRTIKASHVVSAISRYRPTSSYLPSEAVNEDGYVKITPRLNLATNIANAKYHFAAGDIALWSGIKRAGAAMHQGHYAAINIYQQICSDLFAKTPKFVELDQAPPVICIAIGKQAASWSEEDGTLSGTDVLNLYFNDDLGYNICWNYMKLGEPPITE
ncbi:hypothetical protein CISG_06389 [Coccidioides immitis RMSCC 3703]|uniref:FAD/NAD(P)-binding domain-containing protein n=1 Tax=Coccidioides immitis RMSCC 3703 TaxID=454286 RepID=A0A0J8R109_COCIT|nr:hypothetical protein CISG_06389 [Coccidioides immitis RMSCC 3703]